jgi:hypothetical protein
MHHIRERERKQDWDFRQARVVHVKKGREVNK